MLGKIFMVRDEQDQCKLNWGTHGLESTKFNQNETL